MATQTVIQPYYAGNMDNVQRHFLGGPEYTHFKETASQSYIIGDLLYIDTNGTIAIATRDGGTPTLLTSTIAGQAIKAATGTTGASVLFPIIRPADMFFMNVHHETLGSAVGALTDIGTIRGIAKSATVNTTKWVISKQAAGESATLANGDTTIMGFALRHPVGGVVNAITDTYSLALVKFNSWSQSTDAGSDPAPRRVLIFG